MCLTSHHLGKLVSKHSRHLTQTLIWHQKNWVCTVDVLNKCTEHRRRGLGVLRGVGLALLYLLVSNLPSFLKRASSNIFLHALQISGRATLSYFKSFAEFEKLQLPFSSCHIRALELLGLFFIPSAHWLWQASRLWFGSESQKALNTQKGCTRLGLPIA